MDTSTVDKVNVLISTFSKSWIDLDDLDAKEEEKQSELSDGYATKGYTAPTYTVREAKKNQKWVKKKTKRKRKKRNTNATEILPYSIKDWLNNNGYPLFVLQAFKDQNINIFSDFTTINEDELDKILNSLEISDPITKSRLISDIMNYVLKYKHGVFHLKYWHYPNENENELVSEVQDVHEEEKTMVSYNDDKLNTDLTYLGLYKVVILDYLYHKRIEAKPKIEMDKHRNEFLTEISIFIPYKITGFSIGQDELSSELYAYKNLYCKLIINSIWIDKRAFNGLIRKYQIISLPFNKNNGSSDKDNYKLWLYFHGFKQFKDNNETEKAKYFFNKNMEDACGGKEKWIRLYVDKQIIWFHGFYYLFGNEIEASKDIYHMVIEENKDLIWIWMKSYNTRKEFYANVIQYGLLASLNVLKIH